MRSRPGRSPDRVGKPQDRLAINPDQARAYSVSGKPAVADPAANRANVDAEELGGLAGGHLQGKLLSGGLSEVPGRVWRFVSGHALSSIPKGRQVSGVSRSM